jgi:TonB family protein
MLLSSERWRMKTASLMIYLVAASLSLWPFNVSASFQQPSAEPAVVTAVAPEFSPVTALAGAGGDVIVEVKINADGSVGAAKSLGGHPLLSKAAESAALRWRFAPSPNDAEQRVVRLTFTFDALRWDDPSSATPAFVPPYGVKVAFRRAKPADTINMIPKGGRRVCQVHHVPLRRGVVPLLYYISADYPDGYYEASQKLFPNANSSARGSDVHYEDSPEHAVVLYCPKCRMAERAWDLKYQRGFAKRAT